MKFSLLIVSLLLSGCFATLPPKEPIVLEKFVYIVRVPPAETMSLPAPIAEIDIDSSTQADVAEWIVRSEKYTIELRTKLIEIANFFKHEELSKQKGE
jgi:hypothetical protein